MRWTVKETSRSQLSGIPNKKKHQSPCKPELNARSKSKPQSKNLRTFKLSFSYVVYPNANSSREYRLYNALSDLKGRGRSRWGQQRLSVMVRVRRGSGRVGVRA